MWAAHVGALLALVTTAQVEPQKRKLSGFEMAGLENVTQSKIDLLSYKTYYS